MKDIDNRLAAAKGSLDDASTHLRGAERGSERSGERGEIELVRDDVDRALERLQGLREHRSAKAAMTYPRIHAEIHTDDGAVRVDFDATPYFETAHDLQLENVIAEGYAHGYTTDEVAEALKAQNAEILMVFRYLEVKRRGGQTLGYEVSVNQAEAEAWLRAHRPQLLEHEVPRREER